MNPKNGALVTGGTGFLGHGLVPALLERGYERVCILSRGEHAQAAMRESFNDDERLRWFVGDVRDVERLRWAFRDVDLVIHAAALKRIEVGRYNPGEMVQTNVLGTQNVIRAAMDCGVSRVVGVSSDKAWQPVSPYGQSKAMAESLMLAANEQGGQYGPVFTVCRYGNVAGSTGSVIPRWRALKAAGVPCPVTDPECTRFWMSRNEAVRFVLRAATEHIEGCPGVLVPTLPAFRLGDLAQALDVETNVIGLGAWEKQHEGMMDGVTSDLARRMSVDEIRQRLEADC